MATGVVVAVLGTEKDPGKFDVARIFYAAPGEPQPERPLPEKGCFFTAKIIVYKFFMWSPLAIKEFLNDKLSF